MLPIGVEVTLSAEQVAVKGPLGTLTQRLSSDIRLERDGDIDVEFAARDL